MAYYRPQFRSQRPADDPKEPWPGESKARGDEHAWNNCVMTAGGAMLLDFHTRGAKRLWGGDFRHHQGDLSGGTDLGDLKQAWAHVGSGYHLDVRSGQGWDEVIKCHDEGRAIVLQGTGNCPGVGTYTGGHAAIWCPDDAWGDPLTNRWQTVRKDSNLDRASIHAWAARLNPRIQFAVSRPRSA
jgi:hypothetical protein